LSKSIHDILAELREASMDERDKGDLFERLTKRWLEVDPSYSDFFEKVWLFPEWAQEVGKPKNDTGIDLVARERETGDYWAIQCKFYAENARLDKPEIDSFFTASGKNDFNGRIIFSTTDNWTSNAEAALENQRIPVTRIRVQDLDDSAVDWSSFSLNKDNQLQLQDKKSPRPHQLVAIEAAKKHYANADRGKLIMACGTGKTYTSLQIAEEMVPDGGTMLFLVPSIALLSQTLKEWKRESKRKITAYAVCSDSKIGKRKDDEDIQVPDLAYPATTNTDRLAWHFKHNRERKDGFTVIFSTYQSIQVVAEAQGAGVPDFDLIVCDEAHRTTGVTLAESDESSFVRVHDNHFIAGKKRLYMTATPRIYAEQSKTKAKEAEATLASMDDEKIYGEEFHRLNFGQAVSAGLLSDYKVLVLAVSEDHVSRQLQKLLTKDGELDLDDVTKIVGCYNGLRKHSSNDSDFLVDKQPMKTAVAFARSIRDSKKLAELFGVVTRELNVSEGDKKPLIAQVEHVDGTFNVLARNNKLDWLKDKSTQNTVRILSNARCLSEGVDVPALDAVLFLNARDSQVDVVQSVGRVMRKAEGKEYGYVILPITVPLGKTAEEALADNNRYKVVWQVLQALRSHDERFNAMVNKIELNGDTDERLKIIGVGGESDESETSDSAAKETAQMFDFFLDDWKDAILAKIVQKVGERTYWENWAKDVATIASDNISRITALLDDADAGVSREFEKFLQGLRNNLNPHVSEADAIEMLAQHLITKPVFEALFEGYEFTKLNPVSVAMQSMVDILQKQSLDFDTARLADFYTSVRARAEGITDGAAKQKIVKELYEKFFKLAFSSTSERLGIVYTPNEVVDFILHSADHALKSEFGTSLSDRDVHILDPFTGTGTFIVRLLQSGLIKPEDLRSKYKHELHANELVLLAYYVAAINIEETYHSMVKGDYESFDGIVLTDTFQMHEADDKDEIEGLEVFPENNVRVLAQKTKPIRVIVGNPPYSAGQSSANDNNANANYPTLDKRITETYAARTSAQNKNNLYDSYIRSIRWASDRIGEKGLISFVTNNGYIDSNTAAGMRKTLIEEFSTIYIVNYRGNSRNSGETAKREGGNIFNIRVGVATVVLVKNPDSDSIGKINYFEFDDYMTAEQKLARTRELVSIENVPWTQIHPNGEGDWINQRSTSFSKFPPIGTKDKAEKNLLKLFATYTAGLKSNRDAWAYNFSKTQAEKNMTAMVDFYNSQVVDSLEAKARGIGWSRSNDSKKISWDVPMGSELERGRLISSDAWSLRLAAYRPFTKQWLAFGRAVNNSVHLLPKVFPDSASGNFGFYCVGMGSTVPFSVLMTDAIPDFHLTGAGSGGQFFPRYSFDEVDAEPTLLAGIEERGTRDNITDEALADYQKTFGPRVSKDDIFYYIYGLLHSGEYRSAFDADLRKMLPRIPKSANFDAFSKAGRELAALHLNYESLPPFDLEVSEHVGATRVQKMQFGKSGKTHDKSRLILNDSVVISGIPLLAHEYKVGSKSPLEWLVDRYQVKTNEDSGLTNDPNTLIDESGEPDVLVILARRLVTLSVQSAEIIKSLPKLEPLDVSK
jgi:predicted helicase